MEISFVIPSRNNLKYFKWAYESIRKNQGDHTVWICAADDASTDGTREWFAETAENDPYFKYLVNDTGKRQGHTILYDRIVNELVETDVAMIYHADMFLCPAALDAIEANIKPKTIVSLTRIEPPLHPDGPEKVLFDCGVEPEVFNEVKLLNMLHMLTDTSKPNPHKDKIPENRKTVGIFAPWAFYKEDFQRIGGHDPLYRPQSKEDSDIFNRFQLDGVNFIQTWDGFVYHMTCRGSRRNTADRAVNIYEDSPEWLEQNRKSARNFIRKWGSFVKHDKYMKPIIPNKYNVGIVLRNADMQAIGNLEPFCDRLYIDNQELRDTYIKLEQPNTDFDLSERVISNVDAYEADILIHMDTLSKENYTIVQMLADILDGDDGLETGEFEIEDLKVQINAVKTYTDDLIVIPTKYNSSESK